MLQNSKENINPYEGRTGLVYARVSSAAQSSYGHGLESQDLRCINDLKSIGVLYGKSFLDSFTGGGDFMKRPAMRQMIEYIDANPHKKFVVVFDDIARFARDVQFHIKLKAAFRLRDVALRCLNYSFDDTPEGEFAELIMAGNAELFRKQNRRQVIQKQKARLEAGYWPFVCKKGYVRIHDPVLGGVLKPTKQGLEILKPALEGFATGNLLRKIDVAKYLFERGFWKKQSPERYIHLVDKLLRNPFHCGDIEYPEWDVARREGHHTGIISREMYALIQRRLKSNTTRRIRCDISDEFPLRGLVTCSACEKQLTGASTVKRSGIRHPYYYCQHKKCELYGKMLRKDDVERDFRTLLLRNRLKASVGQIVNVVFDRVWNQEMGDVEQKKRREKNYQSELRAKIAEYSEMARRAQLDEVQRAYESQIAEAMNKLKESEGTTSFGGDLNVPYRTALGKVNGVLQNPIEIWENVDVLEKHRLFFFLFDAKLPYTKKDGYRTGDSLSTTRLFEEFATPNTALCGDCIRKFGLTSETIRSDFHAPRARWL